MLVEHDFITTIDQHDVMLRAAQFAWAAGFKLSDRGVTGVRGQQGRKHPSTIRIRKLPQTLEVSYDRGKVSMAIGMTTRNNSDKPAHQAYLLALATGLEMAINGETIPVCLTSWHEVRSAKVWSAMDILGMVVLALLALGGVLAGILGIAMAINL
jgi:hypothetical protein